MRGSIGPLRSRHVLLAAVCAGLPAAEVLVLVTVQLRGSASLAPGVTAAAPYGMYHDLRFLLTYHSSWVAFAAEAAVMVAWRGALDGSLVLLAWPPDVPRPGAGVVVRRTTMFAATAALLLTPSAAMASAMNVIPVSDLFLGGMPLVVVVAMLTSHGAVTSWWRRLPPARAVAWSVATFAVATLGGAVVAAVPAWAAPLAAAGTGVLNGLAWLGVVRATAAQRSSRPLPLVPLGMAAMAGTVIIGITIAMNLTVAAGQRVSHIVPTDAPPFPHVLLVSGFHSAWSGAPPPPLAPGLPVERFSYRGLDSAGRPLSYPPQATQQPLRRTVRLLSQQVEAVHKRSGQRVAIVADSEGSLAVETYLAAERNAPVGKIVLLDPLIDPGRAYFPPPQTEGWGVATGAILRGLGAAIGATTPLRIYADGPFIRSVDDHGPVLQDLLACPSTHVKELVLFSLADAAATPFSARIAAPSGVVMRLHGFLLGDTAATRTVASFLNTGQWPAGNRAAADRLVRAAAAAWQAPPIMPSLVPKWRGQPVSGCAAKRKSLTAWLHGPGAPDPKRQADGARTGGHADSAQTGSAKPEAPDR